MDILTYGHIDCMILCQVDYFLPADFSVFEKPVFFINFCVCFYLGLLLFAIFREKEDQNGEIGQMRWKKKNTDGFYLRMDEKIYVRMTTCDAGENRSYKILTSRQWFSVAMMWKRRES